MFFALGGLGTDSIANIRKLPASQKWAHIEWMLDTLGLEGLVLTESLFDRTLSMALETMPKSMQRFRLLYHMDEPYTLMEPADTQRLHHALEGTLAFAKAHRVLDVSLPPPMIPDRMQPLRGYLRGAFYDVLAAWLPKYQWAGISLSIESRVQGALYVFQGLLDYADFVRESEGLGAMLHIGELSYDGYTETDLLEIVSPLRITSLRIGDANPQLPRNMALDLPVGSGTIGLRRLIAPYGRYPVDGIVSVDASFEEIKTSVELLRNYTKRAQA